MTNAELTQTLIDALEAADLYLNSYDTSAPSRIKTETRGTVAVALELASRDRPTREATWLPARQPRRARTQPAVETGHDPALCAQCAEAEYR